MSHTLYRWTGSSWVLATVGKTVYTAPARWSTEVFGDLSNWYRSNGALDGDGATSLFTVNWRGYYNAIVEDIVWINSHRATLYKNTGGYHCFVR